VFQLACAALALAVTALLAATYLCVERQRAGEPTLTDDFRRRAIQAALAAGALSILALILAHGHAPQLYHRLTGPALPLVIAGVIAGTAGMITLLTRCYRAARILTATAVSAVIWGWGLAQYPQLAGPASPCAAPPPAPPNCTRC
jgi:cytochrome d ubiquinol oxidase subunit II